MASTHLEEMVAEQVKRTPDAVAVIYNGGEQICSVKITYSEMWQRASQICDELRKNGAVNKTVGVCAEPGINLPSILIGILRASSSFFPFGLDGSGFVCQSLQRLAVTHLLLDGSTFQSLQPLLLELEGSVVSSDLLQSLGLCLVRLHSAPGRQQQVQYMPGLAYSISTSGTTSTPKIVRVPHSCIVPNIEDFRKEFQPAVGDVIFLTSPLTFDPSMIDIFMTLTSGAALLVVSTIVKMSPDRLLAMLTLRHRVSILQITPSLFGRFDSARVRRGLLGEDSYLRVLAFGGEMFPQASTLDTCMHPENGTSVYNVYGITEVSCWATLHCARLPKGGVKEPVPVGKALTGTKIKVLDKDGEQLTCGTGFIWIGGSERICLLNEEDKTVLHGGTVWRKTGDLGNVDSEGNVYCLGRDDRQIKRHGKRLDLDTLEKVTNSMDDVDDSRAVYSDARLHLFIKLKGDKEKEWDGVCHRVKSHLLQTLPAQYQPDDVTPLPAFPVTAHGKLDITALLSLHGNRRTETDIKPILNIPSWICRLWQETTGCKDAKLSPTDQFLSSGGDSLKAVQMVAEVEQHLGITVPDFLDILLTRTLAEIISVLQKHAPENKDPKPKTIKRIHSDQADSSSVEMEGVKSTPCLLQNDFIMTEAVTSRTRVFCTSESLAKHSETSEPSVKRRKLSPQKSHVNTEVSLNRERQGRRSGSGGSCVHDRMDSSKQLTVEGTFKSYVKDTVMSASTSFCSQHKEVITSDAHSKTGVSERNSPNPRNDVFIASIGRASTQLMTSLHPALNSAALCCSHQRLPSCKGDDLALKNEIFTSQERGETSGDRIQGELLWTVNTGKCVDASPLVAVTRCDKAVVFIGSHSHLFLAIDMECGTVLWSTKLGDRIEGSACLSPCGQWVLVGCYDRNIYVLRAMTGEVTWKVETGDVVKCTPVSDYSTQLVFCGSHDGFLYALCCKERKVTWKVQVRGGAVFASPVVSPDSSVVFAATLRGHVTAVLLATGTIMWTASLGKPVFSTPAVHADHLYVGCVDSAIYCLSCATGDQMWTFKTEAPVFSSLVVTADSDSTYGRVLFGCHDSRLYCLSADGQLLWRRKTISTVYAAPFVLCLCGGPHAERCHRLGLHFDKKGNKDRRHSLQTCQSDHEQNPQDVAVGGISVLHQQCGSPVEKYKAKHIDTSSKVECIGSDGCEVSRWKTSTVASGSSECGSSTDKGKCSCLLSHALTFTRSSEHGMGAEREKTACVSTIASESGEHGVDVERKRCTACVSTITNGSSEHGVDVERKRCTACVSTITSESGEHGVDEERERCTCVSTITSGSGEHGVDVERERCTACVSTIISGSGERNSGTERKKCCPLIACASTKGRVKVVCCLTGQCLGSMVLPGDVFSSPVVHNKHLVIGCRDDSVYCYKLSSVIP